MLAGGQTMNGCGQQRPGKNVSRNATEPVHRLFETKTSAKDFDTAGEHSGSALFV